MDRSNFSPPSSSKHCLLSPSNHHREHQQQPRWRTPSPMTSSIIPPPIVQSVQSLPPRNLAQSIVVTPPSPLQHRQSELEADLQFLLDAQAEGLVRGLEGGSGGESGSTTPTAQSARSGSVGRTRRVKRRPGLRSARKGIYNAIVSLSALKDDELADIDEDVQDKDAKLEKIDAWDKKRSGLQEATRGIEGNDESVRVQRLRSEANTLQEEIGAVELQLADMKARHRKLLRQVSGIENGVQAKLASYTSSLRMLEEDVQKFLSIEPEENDGRPSSMEGDRNGTTSMWQLPPKRRTLEMARQQFSEDREMVLEQRRSVEHEKTALDEGAEVWKDVVSQINEFEKRLRAEMLALTTPDASTSSPPPQSRAEKLEELVKHLDDLTQTLESKLQLSKGRNWNLLVAAIGAELDALRQGRQILDSVLHPDQQQSPEEATGISEPEPLLSNVDSGNEIDALDKSFHTPAERSFERRMNNGLDSDDDPDPELLFSKHDTDTDSPE